MNASWQKTNILNLETRPQMHQLMWMEPMSTESLILLGPLSLVKISVARILQARHNASNRPGSFSNEQHQSFMVSDASHLDVKTDKS